jgi:diadenosine tetraphosphate (Ap4A) HIT family hydrolase
LDEQEQTAIWSTASIIRKQLQQEFAPHAFNIGMNDGAAAGQTVRHAHLHVIPRYAGDVADPCGGMRWVVPSLADYWSRPR